MLRVTQSQLLRLKRTTLYFFKFHSNVFDYFIYTVLL